MNSDQVLFDIRNVCRITGLGRSRIYVELQAGRLRSIKVGSRRLIPNAALEQWIAERLAETQS
jgi:excisionase family DNA binding protein